MVERHHEVRDQHVLRHASPATSATTGSTPPTSSSSACCPYSNQQMSATFGGPIVRDRLHFFANYEVEREPRTVTFSSPYPVLQHRPAGEEPDRAQGVARASTRSSRRRRTSPRATRTTTSTSPSAAPAAPRAIRRPRAASAATAISSSRTLTQVLGNRAVNEIEGRLRALRLHARLARHAGWAAASRTRRSTAAAQSTISFRGYSVGSAGRAAPVPEQLLDSRRLHARRSARAAATT